MFQVTIQRRRSPARRITWAVLLALGTSILNLSPCRLSAADKSNQPPAGDASATKQTAAERPPFDLTYVPPDATGVIAIRPSAIFADPAMKPLEGFVKNMPALDIMFYPNLPITKLPIPEIEQVVLYTRPISVGKQVQSATGMAMIRAAGDFDWLKWMQQFDPNTKELHAEGIVYYKSHLTNPLLQQELKAYSGTDVFYTLSDKRSLVLLSTIHQGVQKGKSNLKIGVRPQFPWDKEWKHVERDLIAYAQINHQVSGASKSQVGDEPISGWDAMIQKANRMVVGVNWKDGIDFQAYLTGKDRAAGDQIVKNLKAMLATLRRSMDQPPEDEPEELRKAAAFQMQMYKDLVDHAHIQQNETAVRVHTNAKVKIADFSKYLFVPMEIRMK